MSTPATQGPHTRPARFSPEEWEARVQLAAAYRIFDRMGWTELIYNHISLRVPGEPGHFLLNPFGLHYSEVRASTLVKVDVRGNIVGHSDWPINPAGFTFHGAIHETLPEAHCVMHVHTTPTMAVCCAENGLEFTNFYAAQLFGKVAYHDFEGITVHLEEGQRILQSAGDKPVLLLRNHGPVTIGFNLANCFSLMWLLNRACEVQLATHSMGRARAIPDEVLKGCVRDSLNFNPKFGAGQDAFDAMQRLIDREDPSYRS
ncbi:class II aldolase/adducin family protein [Roseateles toxinivorans]|uniref:Ribulose-5-phosphate 4-epimerase/fuculose-1-phosphate aldolase n=1 Tax=Roseateles toxinivorans TaxID=270368 RepID=A0A4R6QPH9_9BURK|nr:class II aldolase/adducin family protein [Roseateles toxinivorans]TDP72770.1 ribulose-5-phosphate 4-epimerase/fuculose-1-phosphate aldolase [Roseateles toxinivorans]